MKAKALKCLLFFSFSFVFGQTSVEYPHWRHLQQVWEDGKLYILDSVKNKIYLEDNNGDSTSLPLPSGSLGAFYSGGQYTSVNTVKDNPKLISVFTSTNGQSWIFKGESTIDNGFPIFLAKTSINKLYLGVNAASGFHDGGKTSFFSWWKEDANGILKFDQLIPLDFEGPIFTPAGIQGNELCRLRPDHGALSPFLDYPIRFPGGFILVSFQSGLMWVLKDGDSSPTQLLNPADLDRDQINGKRPFPRVLLGIQPTPEGKVLFTVRDKDAIKESLSRFNTRTEVPSSPVDSRRARLEEERSILAYPRIEWLEYDPETKKVTKVDLPNVPTEINSTLFLRAFTFSFNRKGILVFPNFGKAK